MLLITRKGKNNRKIKLTHQKTQEWNLKKMSSIPKTDLWINNLPFDVTEEEIFTLFSQYGEVVKVDLPDKKSVQRCYAFIHYAKEEEADAALKSLDGYNFRDRKILVRRSDSVPRKKPKFQNDRPKESFTNSYRDRDDYDSHSGRDKDDKYSSRSRHSHDRDHDKERSSSHHRKSKHDYDSDYGSHRHHHSSHSSHSSHSHYPPYPYDPYYDMRTADYRDAHPQPGYYPTDYLPPPIYRYPPIDRERVPYPPPRHGREIEPVPHADLYYPYPHPPPPPPPRYPGYGDSSYIEPRAKTGQYRPGYSNDGVFQESSDDDRKNQK